jgi:hypothetical protein
VSARQRSFAVGAASRLAGVPYQCAVQSRPILERR